MEKSVYEARWMLAPVFGFSFAFLLTGFIIS